MPGRRLEFGEQPQQVSQSIVRDELDLPAEVLLRFPSFKEKGCAKSKAVSPHFRSWWKTPPIEIAGRMTGAELVLGPVLSA